VSMALVIMRLPRWSIQPRHGQILLLLILIAVFGSTRAVSGQHCETLQSSSFCANVLSYSQVVVQGCQDHQESQLSTLPNILSVLQSSNASDSCLHAVSSLMCVRTFPDCSSTTAADACKEMCDTVFTSCSSVDNSTMTMLQSLLPLDCSSYPTTSCHVPPEGFVPQPPSPPRCSKYAEELNATSGSCLGVIDYLIYIPSGTSFSYLESAASQMLGGVLPFIIGNNGGDACKRTLIRQVCTNVFMACDSSVYPTPSPPVPFAQFPCRSDCTEYVSRCVTSGPYGIPAAVLDSLPAASLMVLKPNSTSQGMRIPTPTNCSTPIPGVIPVDDFPVESTPYPEHASFPAVNVTCNSYINASDTSHIVIPATKVEALDRSSFCSGILSTNYSNAISVLGTCQDYQEGTLSMAPLIFSTLTSMNASQNCQDALAKWMCVSTYPNEEGQLPCADMCMDIMSMCGEQIVALLNMTLPRPIQQGCLTQTATDCYTPTSDAPYDLSMRSLPTCADYKLSGGQVCEDLIDYSIYIPYDTSFALLEGTASYLGFMEKFIPPTSEGAECYRAFRRQLCTNIFQPCDDTLLTGLSPMMKAPFPSFPCRNDCEDYVSKCRFPTSVLSQLPVELSYFLAPNCSSVGHKFPTSSPCGRPSTTQQPVADFPITSTTFPSASLPVTIQTQCNAINENITNAMMFVPFCPEPLVVPDDPADVIDGTGCALPCPLILYTREEWETTDTMTTVFMVFSVVFNGFLFVTWILFDSKRKQTYVVMFAANVFFMTLALIIGAIITNGHPGQINCANNAHFLTQDDADHYCPWQAVFVHLFALSGGIWWSVIAFDIFLLLFLGVRLSPKDTRRKKMIYFLVAEGFPLLTVCIGAGLKGFGQNGSLGWCFLTGTNNAAEWTLFWVPIIICTVVGCGCMICIGVMLWKSSRRVGTSKRAGAWKQYVRPFLFLMEFLGTFSFVLA